MVFVFFPKKCSQRTGGQLWIDLGYGVVLVQCAGFFGHHAMFQEYRKSTALCFSVLTTAGILFDEACLADQKGSMLEFG